MEKPEVSNIIEAILFVAGEPVTIGDLAAALDDAGAAIQEGQSALAANDFAAYGAAQDKLNQAIQRAIAAQEAMEAAAGATDGGTTGATEGATPAPTEGG